MSTPPRAERAWKLPGCPAAAVGQGAGIRAAVLTCHAARQPRGAGAGAGTGLWGDPLTQEHIGDEVEAVAWDIPQQHGAGAPVQSHQAVSAHDGRNAMHRPLIGWLLPVSRHPGL